MGNPIVYQFLRLLLFFLTLFGGYYISRGNKRSRVVSSVFLCLTYVLIQGSRYGGGVDFPHYNEDLIHPENSNYVEYLYLGYIYLIGSVFELPSYVGFWGYAFLLVVSIVLVSNKMNKAALWIVLVMLVTTNQIENLIRQYFAISFIIFAFYFYLKSNERMMYLSLLTVPFVHYTGLFPVLLFLFFIKVKIPKWKLIEFGPLIVYIVLVLFWDVHVIDDFGIWLQTISRANAVLSHNGYLHNADLWFSTQKMVEMSTGSLYYVKSIIVFAQNVMLIYFGYKLTNRVPKMSVCYYFWLISLLVSTLGGGLEMFIRFSQWTSFMTPFIIGAVLTFGVVSSKKLNYALMALVVMNYSYTYFSMTFKMPFGCAYFWDQL